MKVAVVLLGLLALQCVAAKVSSVSGEGWWHDWMYGCVEVVGCWGERELARA